MENCILIIAYTLLVLLTFFLIISFIISLGLFGIFPTLCIFTSAFIIGGLPLIVLYYFLIIKGENKE